MVCEEGGGPRFIVSAFLFSKPVQNKPRNTVTVWQTVAAFQLLEIAVRPMVQLCRALPKGVHRRQ